MIFKGHHKTSFIDYPDKLSTVFFVGGCNFRCPYCHNGSLVRNEGVQIGEDYLFEFLKKRQKLLDAVCLSGGEPTLYEELPDFIVKIKAMGYLVKLDTNGTHPSMIEYLISQGLLDYIAMDVKAPLNKYKSVVDAEVDNSLIKRSIRLIKDSGLNYEFRTTVCRELLTEEDILQITEELRNSKRYIIQNYKDGPTILAGKGHFTPYSKAELEEIGRNVRNRFEDFKIRG